MSYRGEPKTLLKAIGDMADDVSQLKRGNTGVKQQNIRIGDQLISEGGDDNTLIVTDLDSGNTFSLPQDRDFEVTFSWGGQVSDINAINNTSPVYLVTNNITIDTIIFTVFNVSSPPYLSIRFRILDSSGGVQIDHTVNTTVSTGPGSTTESVAYSVSAGSYIQAVLLDDGDGTWGNISITAKW